MPFPRDGLRLLFEAFIMTLPVGMPITKKHQYRESYEIAEQQYDKLPLFSHALTYILAELQYQWKKSDKRKQHQTTFQKSFMLVISIVLSPIQIPVYIGFQPDRLHQKIPIGRPFRQQLIEPSHLQKAQQAVTDSVAEITDRQLMLAPADSQIFIRIFFWLLFFH